MKTSASFDQKLKDISIINVLENYARFLIKENLVSSNEELKDRIGTVCSAAIERGIITHHMIDVLYSIIDNSIQEYQTVKAQKKVMDLVTNVISCPAMQNLNSSVPSDIVDEFNELAAAKQTYDNLKNTIISKYGEAILNYANEFYEEFEKKFDSKFIEYEQGK